MTTPPPPLSSTAQKKKGVKHPLFEHIPAAYRENAKNLTELCSAIDEMLRPQWDAVDNPETVFSSTSQSQWLAHFAEAPSSSVKDVTAAESTFPAWGTVEGLKNFLLKQDESQSVTKIKSDNRNMYSVTTTNPVQALDWVTRHLVPAHITVEWKSGRGST
ncbi:hypothetical protein ACIBEA_43095 [Streptomyces sp. NPDC051555]|uniref:hypothetical protein n=1 Tax=Streptomyces sp. NPDC051555 TaxID=3365657 RepID=UPI0037900BDA